MTRYIKFRYRGQAMTEFLICTSFVLLPMLLGYSLLAKYIDIKQTSIQAARYEAWEYTVWYADDTEPMTGFSATSQPLKSTTRVRDETRQRFFTDPMDAANSLLIRSDDADTGWQIIDRNRLWTDHNGNRLYSGLDGSAANVQSSEDTPTIPVIGDVMNTLLDIIDFAFSAIGSLMNFIGSSVGFTAINTDGYAKATTSLAVTSNPEFIDMGTMTGSSAARITALNQGNLMFSSSAGVLTDGWNAGGVEHTYNQAGGTVPTVLLKELLNLPVLSTIYDVITILAPELRRCHPSISPLVRFDDPQGNDKGSLWWGHIDIDAVHPDRLGGRTGTHSCDDAGRCDFEPEVPRPEELWDCIP